MNPTRTLGTLLLAAAFSLLQAAPGLGATVVGPYDSAGTFEGMTPDASPLGLVTAEASANRLDGTMVAQVSSRSETPGGGVIVPTYLGPWSPSVGVGGSWAYAWGEVRHQIEDVAQGERRIVTEFGSISTLHSSSPARSSNLDYFGHANPGKPSAGSAVQLHAVVSYFSCSRKQSCSASFSQRIVEELPTGLENASWTLSSKAFTAVSGGRVEVRAAVVGWATARGQGSSAAATGSGTLVGISIT